MEFIIENIRLRELVAVVNENRAFYEDFLRFLNKRGYRNIHEFINEIDDIKAMSVISEFLVRDSKEKLYDGLGNPYNNLKANWFFLSWLLRDAPAQRLQPLVATMHGNNLVERRANLLNILRNHVKNLFPNPASWEWPSLSEILIARLEGSRRALKGTLFEAVIRRCLAELFEKHDMDLKIGDKQVRIENETYDVPIYGLKETVLIPVKTRETMGGGHALLFTRDIHKSIAVAKEAGFICFPIIIAESWGGKLDELGCDYYVYIQANPNQVAKVEPMLKIELEKFIHVFTKLL